MDIGLAEIVFTAIAAILSAIALRLRRSDTSTRELIAELRKDADEKTAQIAQLQKADKQAKGDIAALKSSGLAKDSKIARLEQQIDTLTTQIGTMQDALDAERERRENGEQENARLNGLIAERDRLNNELFEANKAYALQVASYERAFSLMQRPEPGESKPESAGEALSTPATGEQMIIKAQNEQPKSEEA